MNRNQRIKLLKKISQTPPAAPTQPAATTTATPVNKPQISIRSLPNFNERLFQIRPDIINDLNTIINIINTYLLTLTQDKVGFDMVWNNPSITGSEFTNGVKNLLNLAKWLYSVVRSNANAYNLSGLKQIATGLIATVQGYSFPEPEARDVQNKLVTAGQAILAKLGGA